MALARKCDKCGKVYEFYGSQSKSNAIIPAYVDKIGFIVTKFSKWDLCPECKESLETWLNGGQ